MEKQEDNLGNQAYLDEEGSGKIEAAGTQVTKDAKGEALPADM